ncbi:MAG: 50S ribosomal protein L1 [Parachlamydiales bacterium]
MAHKSKRYRACEQKVEQGKGYSVDEAVTTLLSCPKAKFDESVDISIVLGVDPRKADQQVRATCSLPHGTGKKVIVCVLTKGEKIQQALAAGADFAGDEEFIAKIQAGWTDFSVLIATPDMMREVGKLGKVLGPRGLMPTPKAGTVTTDVAGAVKEAKAGKFEFKVDKASVVNCSVGKVSFKGENLAENIRAFLSALWRAKPTGAKGVYMRKATLSSTMGPGLEISAGELPSS